MIHFSFFLVALAASFAGVSLLRRWALRKQLFDIPNARSSHTTPTPRAGGLALVVIVLLLWGGWIVYAPFKLPLPLHFIGLAIVGSLLTAFISWMDDVRGGVSSALRFSIHLIAALVAIYVYGWWTSIEIPGIGVWSWGWLGLAVTVIWIAGLINAYNFMDGIDGIAATQAITACAGWVVVGWEFGQHAVSLCSMILAGACLGFLILNWPPAKIFMGDVGSAFLGFSFATMPLIMQASLSLLAKSTAPLVSPRLPVTAFLFVAPFVLDAAYTFGRRLLKRENVFAAHRSHLYQRLVISGLPHRTVTLLYGALGLIGTSAGITFALSPHRPQAAMAAAGGAVLCFVIPFLWVTIRERLPQLIILSAGQFGREVYNWAADMDKAGTAPWRIRGFLDDNPRALEGYKYGVPILGRIADYIPQPRDRFVCAIGNPSTKKQVCAAIQARGGAFTNVIHPTAVMGRNVNLGTGVVLGPCTVLTCDTTVGDHTTFATSNTAGHDTQIGRWCHVGGHCEIGGGAIVGDGAFLGGRVEVPPRARVPAWTRVAPGSVIPEPGANTPVPDAQPPAEPPPPAAAARLFLSPPHMGGSEQRRIQEVFASNYIAPTGPMVDAFEREFAEHTGFSHCVAVASGTAAMHLALRTVGVKAGDHVFASTLTFIGSVTPIAFQNAVPVFIDASPATWCLDPGLLEQELRLAASQSRLPKAVIPTDLYGQSCDLDRIVELCAKYDIPVICDAAESEGARYHGRHAGKGARAAVFSFNGNKIITTSGGGMLASDDPELIRQARYLSTQARDPLPYYEHHEIGYNYRMSNVLAAIGRGQLQVLEERVHRRREIFTGYQSRLGGIPGIEFMPEAPYGTSNRWLTVILITPALFGATAEEVRLRLEEENIESRPVWKPMHLQPVFRGCRAVGGKVSEDLFARGLCLPSGTAMTDSDLDRVCAVIRAAARGPIFTH